ncbi:hypothetical protein SAMN05421640_3607 [Ekhidna lutea]|uniref:Uncharacterized protein n=1 Tax=Ekhidna lutea TaxID=447679 RepID=A0A239M574_EKHLU|nr:hypothetical protein [Ekhidna lutea]SNT37029.1 hypothetical protein SAMN05421640_3607 [Ekhidna lutea]
MIFDTSYSDKETTRQINLAVGLPFSWKQRWKMGGIGSRRMTITRISEEYQSYMNAKHYISTANIELRPKGIIIHFRHKLQAYSWIMPYNSLKTTYDNLLRLESDGKFIEFEQPNNHQFIQQMMRLKKEF